MEKSNLVKIKKFESVPINPLKRIKYWTSWGFGPCGLSKLMNVELPNEIWISEKIYREVVKKGDMENGEDDTVSVFNICQIENIKFRMTEYSDKCFKREKDCIRTEYDQHFGKMEVYRLTSILEPPR